MIRTAVTVTALTAAFLITPPPTTPPTADTTPPPLTAVDVASRYQSATQADRSTRDPIPTPKPLTTPTNPPKPTPPPTPNDVAPTSPTPDTNQTPTGALPPLLLTIRAHESGGNYQAYNPTAAKATDAAAPTRLHARYAPVWAARAGYPGMAPNAATWPPATQDKVALNLYYSTNPDGAHWCSYTGYC